MPTSLHNIILYYILQKHYVLNLPKSIKIVEKTAANSLEARQVPEN